MDKYQKLELENADLRRMVEAQKNTISNLRYGQDEMRIRYETLDRCYRDLCDGLGKGTKR